MGGRCCCGWRQRTRWTPPSACTGVTAPGLVIASAITPIPFKVFTVLSGVMDMELRGFLVAALIGRGIRFMTVGVLIALYGDSVEELIRERFEYVTIGAVAAGLALVAALLAVRHVRRRSVASDSGLRDND